MIPDISSGVDTAQVNATNPPSELPTIIILFEFIGLITVSYTHLTLPTIE